MFYIIILLSVILIAIGLKKEGYENVTKNPSFWMIVGFSSMLLSAYPLKQQLFETINVLQGKITADEMTPFVMSLEIMMGMTIFIVGLVILIIGIAKKEKQNENEKQNKVV